MFECRLAYGTNIGKIKKIFKYIGEELQVDPELGPGLLEALKSEGTISTEESRLVVQAEFMAEPGDFQYVIRCEAYDRILKAFAANGIRFAQRQVTGSILSAATPDSDPSAPSTAAAVGGVFPPEGSSR